jgi:hypothetical protein
MDFYFGESLNSPTFEYGTDSAMGADVTSSDGDPAHASAAGQVFLGLTPFQANGADVQYAYGTLATLSDDAPSDYKYLVFFANDFSYWNGTGGDFSAWTGAFDKEPEFGQPKTGISVCVVGINASPVPIPAAIWLMGSGLGALAVSRRRRRV